MPECDINGHDEAIADIYDYGDANTWGCGAGSSNLDYEYRANGWVHVPDAPDVEDGPYCPIAVLDALENCGWLACMIVNGEVVSPEEAAEAAGRAVKCLADYQYEQQPWFAEAWPFVKDSEPHDTRSDNGELDEMRDDGIPNGDWETTI